jgi:ATP-dependent Lhr-like helicase
LGGTLDDMPLSAFTPTVREWFERSFAEPTPAQAQAWPAIATGEHVLISAPTGSGKTLAAFLWGLDRLSREHADHTRLVYVSPLKALAYDVDRNLRAPLRGIGADLTVGIRTGDTPQRDRMAMRRTPPDILITTPESLYLVLTSQARDTLRGVEAVIVDEIHAVAGTKRGAHLALTLERLAALQEDRTRSTAHRPERDPEPARGGRAVHGRSAPQGDDRRHRRAQAAGPAHPRAGGVDGRAGAVHQRPRPAGPVVGGESTRKSIWPAIYPELLELVRAHRSTIVFVNNRRGAERLALRLNGLANADLPQDAPPREIARAHHGSLAREERTVVEELLKAGELPCLVATSSLELGIDMGAVDLVLQVESPKSVARGLQRIGRAGHSVGDVSKGRIFPKFRADLLESAVVAKLMREGRIEPTVVPRNPLDVLAQQIVAISASTEPEPVAVDDLYALVTRTHSYAELSRELLENVLDMLDGRYPSQEFAELRPRIVWDRVAGTIRARKGARQLAVTNAGTIPDRGLFSVVLPDGRRVGELDEEMVYEARPGQTFLLGASTWRIEDIGRDRVTVTRPRARPRRRADLEGRLVGRHQALARQTAPSRAGRRPAAPTCSSATTTSTRCAAKPPGLPARAAGRPRPAWSPSDRDRRESSASADEIGDSAAVRPTPFGRPRARAWALALSPPHRDEYGWSPTRSGRTTGSSSTCPTPTSRPAPTSCWSSPTSSRTSSVGELGASALFGAASARTPGARCSSRAPTPASARRCGSSA